MLDAAENMIKRQDVFAGVNYSINAPSSYYDGLNRPTMWEQTAAGDVPFARSWYQDDNVGREVATWRDEESSKGERFAYDTTNQVTSAKYKADQVWTGTPLNAVNPQEYTYTPDILNRSSVTENGAVTNYATNGMNQMTSLNGQTIGYDGNFNYASIGGWGFGYDAENRLTSLDHSGPRAAFVYDGLGRCVRRTIEGVTTLITYDAWNPILEWDQGGNWTAVNVYGAKADEILVRVDVVHGPMSYKRDRQGNITFVLGGSTQIIEQYTYDAFGRPTIMNGSGVVNDNLHAVSAVGNRFMFQGREYFGELGLSDFRRRFYAPALVRFLQTDPMGLQTEGEKLTPEQKALYGAGAPEAFGSSEMNLYRYCGDDPVDKSDPLGLLTVIVAGYGPGQSEDSNTKWSNQQFIQNAKATDPHNYAVFRRDQKREMMKAIAGARAKGDNTVKIFGYSRGAVAGVQLAQRLDEMGISVDRLVTVDPVRVLLFGDSPTSFHVPDNVKRAENYYHVGGHGGLFNFPGTPLNGNVVNHPLAGFTPNGMPIIHQTMPSVVAEIFGY